ncbi:CNH-domain-containing protein [Peniophora sp. CONT]|nr:CNH-domain-containing protein [Peniophora sp. CONT]
MSDARSIYSITSDSRVPAPSLTVDTSPSLHSAGTSPKPRRSSESARTLPPSMISAVARRSGANASERSGSVSSFATAPGLRSSLMHDMALAHGLRPPSTISMPGSPQPPRKPRRTPIVYPALLSRVAEAFAARIALADRVRDGLTYKDAFDGRQAVDKIAYIIKTTDRNLALLLGRALDAQKFFHAVTYDHRLRDSAADLYQFRGRGPFGSGELQNPHPQLPPSLPPKIEPPPRPASAATQGSSNEHSTENGASTPVLPLVADEAEPAVPTGVFTLLTDCYSPTCSREQLCYSITCPRRLEQQTRLKRPQNDSSRTLGDGLEVVDVESEALGGGNEGGMLWIHSVPKEIADSVSDQEKKRQEAINEVVYTERDFVKALEYLRDSWITPLKTLDIIPEERRATFVQDVFWNVLDVLAVNTRLRDALSRRQKQYAVVEQLGDVFLEAVPHFSPFVAYGAHQMYGKYEFEKEKANNPAFAAFVEETERRPESQKLELNAYLTKPTTRLARYPLLLEAVLKQTPEDNPDKEALPQVVTMVREFLKEVNLQTGRAENRFSLLQLDQQLIFRPGEQVDLRLRDEGRQQIFKSALRRSAGDSGELMVFLFDHALLMVKQKRQGEQYKVYRRPIPLELLYVAAPDETAATSGTLRLSGSRATRARPGGPVILSHAPHSPVINVKLDNAIKGGYPLVFAHLGRKAYQITLWASTLVSQRKWLEHVGKQQEEMRKRSRYFEMESLSEGFFVGANAVNCAAPFNQGRQVVYGTNDGVYLSDLAQPLREPVKVLALTDVSQIDVLDDYGLLIVLSEGIVITFPLDALEAIDPMAGLKRAKRISSHTSFFKTGICLNRTFVCVVKTSPLSSTIKILEPIDQNVRGRAKPTFRKLLQGGNDTLQPYKEFYIPMQSSSIHFLRTRLCVACVNGFDVIDPESLDIQGLLDPSDESLDFVRRRADPVKPKPMAIYRIDNEFLLCYDEFAFYINRSGWRSRRDFMVYWEGTPTGFALHYPYVLAFEPSFVEIRNVETGAMAQIVQGNNLRVLFTDIPPSPGAPPPQRGYANGYQQPYASASYGGRPQHVPHPGAAGYNSAPVPLYNPPARGRGRDEIIMVSDDRVLSLRLAQPDVVA